MLRHQVPRYQTTQNTRTTSNQNRAVRVNLPDALLQQSTRPRQARHEYPTLTHRQLRLTQPKRTTQHTPGSLTPINVDKHKPPRILRLR
jgi:hypothetical protein